MRPLPPFNLACIISLLLLAGSFEVSWGGAAADEIEMKEMTWVEIRAALNCGYRSVIVPTGGIEQNGPHMILGKHDYIVSAAAHEIAAKLGNVLVAPVVSFVPEGDFAPPTGNMRFQGTIGISEAAFELVLDGIARSLKSAGFKAIILIGDHGQSQAAQSRIALKLTEEFRADHVRVVQIDSYYDDHFQINRLMNDGETLGSIGDHAGIIDTSELMSVHPAGIKTELLGTPENAGERLGASGSLSHASASRGRELLQMRVDAATDKIRSILTGP